MNIKLLLLALPMFPSCKDAKVGGEIKWSNATFESSISENPIFQSLYGSSETIFTYTNLPEKDTCGVAFMDIHAKENSFKPSNYYRCHAYPDSTKLLIDIGFNYLLGGAGFVIQYADKKFFTRLYRWSDSGAGAGADYIIIKQKLVLNKAAFNLGDSIYGKIYFHITEISLGEKKDHYEQGIFRAKIKQPEYTQVNGKTFITSDH